MSHGGYDDDGDGEGKQPGQSTVLVRLAEKSGARFFQTPDGDAYATIEMGDHLETWSLRSKQFKLWLAALFYANVERTPNGQAIADAMNVLEGRATQQGDQHPVHVRVAGDHEALYIDLCDADWQSIRLTTGKCGLVQSAGFRRAKAMLPLPEPDPKGDVAELRKFINVDDKHWPLLLGWMVAALRPRGPYPLLALNGVQGSGKSTQAAMARSVIDPNAAPLRAEPREARDLMIAANNGWVIALDNLSHVPQWLSDALCRLSTGGGFSTRQLYSDGDEVIFYATRPVILTGITEVATKGDLLDRSIVLPLEPIPEHKRRPEAELWAAFEEARPRILGGLIRAVRAAMVNLPRTRLDKLPRMADFALWATAAEPGLGLAPGAFMRAYEDNRADANVLALESDLLAKHIVQLADTGKWEGTPTELHEHLSQQAGDQVARGKHWPKSPAALTGRLRRLAPNLERIGVQVEDRRESGGQRTRTVSVRKNLENVVPSVPSVPIAANHAENRDDAGTTQGISGRRRDDDHQLKTPIRDDRDDRDDVLPALLADAAGDPDDEGVL